MHVRTSTLPYYWSIYFIFFRMNPFAEPRCGPMTGAGGDPLPLQSSAISPAMTESDLPQPLVVRSPSVSMMKWPSTPSPTKTTPTRQVSPPHVPTFFYRNSQSCFSGEFQLRQRRGGQDTVGTREGLLHHTGPQSGSVSSGWSTFASRYTFTYRNRSGSCGVVCCRNHRR